MVFVKVYFVQRHI